MRLHPAVVSHVEEVLREVLRFTGPADAIVSRYFREHPKLGGRERNAIAEGVFAVLRNKLAYASFAESGTAPALSPTPASQVIMLNGRRGGGEGWHRFHERGSNPKVRQ